MKAVKKTTAIGWKLKLRIIRLRIGSYIFPSWGAREAEEIFLVPKRIPRPLTEKSYFDSSRKTELVPGVKTFEWGPEQGPVIGLFHGWSGRGTQMAAFAEPLAAKGFRVVAVDAPAHGDSDGLKLHVGLYARLMLDLEKRVGPFHGLVAHSFGAGCAVVASYWGLQAKKLVLIAGPAKYSRVVDMFFQRSGLSGRAQKIFLKNLSAMVGLSSEQIDIAKLGAGLNVQALIVHDEGDAEVLYRSALEMHGAWSNSKLMTTQGLGHRRVLKDPAVVAAVVEFMGPPPADL